ncbi:MAG: hypothetical protein K6F63_03580 [Lachnospiraceae bacterium]|nr:hypothetical protein [Lachnospiraceae bacterium]
MTDNQSDFSNRGNGLDRRQKNIIMIAVLAVVVAVLIIVAIFGITKLIKNRNNANVTPVATPTPVETVKLTPTTPPAFTPTVTPTAAPTATPAVTEKQTPTPEVKATATPTPTVAPTKAPTATPTTAPVNNKITADQGYKILCSYSKESLSIAKNVTEYKASYDSSTTLINGLNCYRYNLSETVDGKVRNRGEFYISDDGKSCFVEDIETGTFVPLPQG